ncbi:MAG: hypothetical protein PHI23_04780, partial [Candidatus Peribacteraceae bacterium]|nr:hypothetical protein [Candidatus Peribacteraceae bacterium]
NRMRTNLGIGKDNFRVNTINQIKTDVAHPTNKLNDVAMRQLIQEVKRAGGNARDFSHVQKATETALGIGQGLENNTQTREKFNQWMSEHALEGF